MRPNTNILQNLSGVGIKVDHAAGSKILVEMAKIGYSISYDEVKCFEQSVAVKKNSSTQNEVSSAFIQWVGVICDHNAAMLDDRGTFHLMGKIECAIKKGR